MTEGFLKVVKTWPGEARWTENFTPPGEDGNLMSIAYVEIRADILVQLLKKSGRVFRVISGLPEDAVFMGVCSAGHTFSRRLDCYFLSKAFKPVPDGAEWPRLEPAEIKSYEAGLTADDVDYLRWLQDMLATAPRVGHEVDDPEGHCCIHISDTLARQIATRLREIVGPHNA